MKSWHEIAESFALAERDRVLSYSAQEQARIAARVAVLQAATPERLVQLYWPFYEDGSTRPLAGTRDDCERAAAAVAEATGIPFTFEFNGRRYTARPGPNVTERD